MKNALQWLFGVGALVALASCEEGVQTDRMSSRDIGTWEQLRAPPDAPAGTFCWLWRAGGADVATGGPSCWYPDDQCPARAVPR